MTDWKKIKSEYIRGKISQRDLAKKYGVSLSSITRRSKKENWSEMKTQAEDKARTKVVESVASEMVKDEENIQAVADMLLKKILDMINDAEGCKNARDLKSLTASLRDVKEIKGIKTDLEIEEQKARIAKLRKEAKEESVEDKSIRIVIEKELEDYSV